MDFPWDSTLWLLHPYQVYNWLTASGGRRLFAVRLCRVELSWRPRKVSAKFAVRKPSSETEVHWPGKFIIGPCEFYRVTSYSIGRLQFSIEQL